jgi:hypothetical protein
MDFFARARDFMESGDRKNATALLQRILEMRDFESRHSLQTHHSLRELGVAPPQSEEKQVLGVVVEVGMNGGMYLVVGYADHRARHYSYAGAAVVWERPNDSLDEAIEELLRSGSTAARVMGPWKGARPPAPANGRARVNFLPPGGLHFGEGLSTLSPRTN